MKIASDMRKIDEKREEAQKYIDESKKQDQELLEEMEKINASDIRKDGGYPSCCEKCNDLRELVLKLEREIDDYYLICQKSKDLYLLLMRNYHE